MTVLASYGLKFGPARIVMTRFGERQVANAAATEEFWTAWRADKDTLKRAGFSVAKKDNGEWEVSIWQATQDANDKAAAVEASRAADANIEIPIPAGRELLPYQKAGVAYALARPATLIADEMGLGKTIQAIAIANTTQAQRILVICPASLLANWRNEIKRWQTLDHPIQVLRAGARFVELDRGWTIINYDIVARYSGLKAREWDLIILDETHYLKNPKAKRTKWILGGGARGEEKVEPIAAKRKLLLTGTPILNRPAEIFSLLKYLDPPRWASFKSFATRYCGAFFDGYALQMGEPSHLDELQERLRSTVMVRRLKADVLTELPAKRRQIVPVDVNGSADLVAAELAMHERTENALAEATARAERAKAEGSEDEYRAAVAKLEQVRGVGFGEMSKLRHETAVAKIPAVIEHLRNTDGKVVVFCHHLDVVAALIDALADDGVVSITGDTANEKRQDIVDKFQTDPSIRFFIGNIKAAGVGITLTASSHVVFAELDWTPGNVTQAEDRCHRIGQYESVLVQHLVFDGSLDARMAELLVEKQEAIDKALNDRAPAVVYPAYVPAPVQSVAEPEAQRPRQSRQSPTIELTKDQVDAIHAALRVIADYDNDRARELNGVGFSKFDTAFGCDLAAKSSLSPRQAAAAMKLVRRYKRQYSAELHQRIFGE